MSSINDESADPMKSGLMRSRLNRFLDDPEASKLLGEMSAEEIAFAVKSAIGEMIAFIDAKTN